jgi:head-tail adaptor
MDGVPSIDTNAMTQQLRTWAFQDGLLTRPGAYGSEDNEVAWPLLMMMKTSDIGIVWTDIDRRLLLLYCKRYGLTTLGVREKFDDIHRFSSEMLGVMETKPRSKKRSEGVSDVIDAWFANVDDVDPFVAKRHYAYGEWPPFASSEVPITTNEDGAFGLFLRGRLMNLAVNNSKVYVGLGDRWESVSNALRVGVRSRHLNVRRSEAYSLQTVFDSGVVDQDKWKDLGQLKLSKVDGPMIVGNHEVVLAIGGSPGHHFSEFGWANKKLVIVDPLPIAESLSGIAVHFAELFDIARLREYVGNSTYVVLDDTRSDVSSMEDVEKEDTIARDWGRSLSWYTTFVVDRNCRGVSLKMRTLRNQQVIPYPSMGQIYYQPYVWGGSTETRCFVLLNETGVRDVGMTTISRDLYEERVSGWNAHRLRYPFANDDQAKALLEVRVEIENAENYKASEIELPVALFSLSSTINDRELVKRVVRNNDSIIAVIVSSTTSQIWPDGMHSGSFVKNHDGLRFSRVADEAFVDWAYQPEEFLGLSSVCTIADLVTAIDFNDLTLKRRDKRPRVGFDGQHPFMQLWFCVYKFPLFEDRWQTWLNSQTHIVRLLTPQIREIYNHDKSTLHAIRRATMLSLYSDLDVRVVEDKRVNGSIRFNGKVIYVAIAGHMINLLLISSFWPVDFARYMRVIEFNVRVFSRKEKGREVNRWSSRHLLAESNWRLKGVLWHSYFDWYGAVGTYLAMAKILGFPVNVRGIRYVIKELQRIRAENPRFNEMGFQSLEFSKGRARRG